MKKMKKFLLGICCVSFALVGISHAVSIEWFTTAIDKQTEKKGNTQNQIKFLESLQTLLTSSSFKNSPYSQIFEELANYSYEKIQKIKNQTSSNATSSRETKKSDGSNYINIDNVDIQKVKDTVLGRHNDERRSRGVTPYSYHSDLEKSATTWANLLNTEARTSNTHTRKSWDWYYNYNSITAWFNELEIFFPNAGGGKAAFSESVGRGYYKCSSSDCTDALIKQLKTTRDFFMSEKGSNWSHYRAITMSHFTQMGIGISIDEARKRYYLVLHYGMDPIYEVK